MSSAKNERWVVKLGSAQLTDENGRLSQERIAHWAKNLSEMCRDKIEIVLVSSGAVAAGVGKLDWDEPPTALHQLQAAAAVGQMALIQTWQNEFSQQKIDNAQILLTHADLSDRSRYLNAKSTLVTLIEQKIVPIINENDTVATEEIRVGDNDTLAAMVSNLIEADLLVIITDQDGLYESDPRSNPDARFIRQADSTDPSLLKYAGEAASASSRGGMRTKVEAAKIAAFSGTDTLIVNGQQTNVLQDIAAGKMPGTLLEAPQQSLAARKQWIASQLEPQGQLTLDDGAVEIIRNQNKSLLAVGVLQVSGKFKRGDLVNCTDQQGNVIASGLCNYSSEECTALTGKASSEIEATLGYVNESALIHKDNLIIL